MVTAPNIGASNLDLDWLPLTTAVATQVAAGLLLGFLAFLIFSAVQAAGSLVDLFGGFTVAPCIRSVVELADVNLWSRLPTNRHHFAVCDERTPHVDQGVSHIIRGHSARRIPSEPKSVQRFTSQTGAFFLAAMEIASTNAGSAIPR